ncbi:MAG TPA: PhzF family phenazine biosynthesis protein [Tissierellia bacterium]|nr:PhzF family phenazine biosynthesis protein [Tissierellia bacterium]
MKFYIVDAFTQELFGGNPAGVVVVGPRQDFPSEEIMQKTAAELRYSETAFVKKLDDRTFWTRYFTPEAEVDLCGHATIATFHALRQEKIIPAKAQLLNRTKAGDLSIVVNDGQIYMEMGRPKALGVIGDQADMAEIYHGLGIGEVVDRLGNKLLPEIVSTGLPDILVPVPDETILNAIKPDFRAISQLSEKHQVVGVHVFTVGSDSLFHVRNFAPLYGIDEEAATGTANGALTYYLHRHGLIQPNAETVFIQGEAMARPSRVSAVLSQPDGAIRIFVGGQAVSLASGHISLY